MYGTQSMSITGQSRNIARDGIFSGAVFAA